MPNSDVAHIYALYDPRTSAIKYIGKTTNIKRRRRQHLWERKTSAFAEWLKELKVLGLEPSFFILTTCAIREWQLWEKMWIKVMKEIGCELLNSTIGGDGVPIPYPRRPEVVARIAAKLRGRKASPELREKLRLAHLGIPLSDKHKESLRRAHQGMRPCPEFFEKARARRWSEEERQAISRRMIGNKRNLGKKRPPMSEELRQRIRENSLKQYQIPGMREKISIATRLGMARAKNKELNNG